MRVEGGCGLVLLPATRWGLGFGFFFFQAEDGIRDLTVTGVQTCALPISRGGGALAHEHDAGGAHRRAITRARQLARRQQRCGGRSGERRVGEEGRSRWSPYHLKKKKTSPLHILCRGSSFMRLAASFLLRL